MLICFPGIFRRVCMHGMSERSRAQRRLIFYGLFCTHKRPLVTVEEFAIFRECKFRVKVSHRNLTSLLGSHMNILLDS